MVSSAYLNNLLYYINSDDTYAVSDVSMINSNIIKLVLKLIPYRMIESKNYLIDKENGYKIYGQLYKKILEKIDKIMELI